jgi:hypothetical protein
MEQPLKFGLSSSLQQGNLPVSIASQKCCPLIWQINYFDLMLTNNPLRCIITP